MRRNRRTGADTGQLADVGWGNGRIFRIRDADRTIRLVTYDDHPNWLVVLTTVETSKLWIRDDHTDEIGAIDPATRQAIIKVGMGHLLGETSNKGEE